MNNKSWKYKFFGGTDLDGKRLSWAAVAAGVVSFTAVLLVLTLIGFAIGLTTVNPLADNMFAHVGTGVTIWTVIALVLSFATGGFVSGLVANKAGALHGFMTWATGILLATILATNIVGSAVSTAGNIVGGVAGGVGTASSKLVNKAGETAEEVAHKLSAEMDSLNFTELEGQLKDVLRDTDVKELQPNYLADQVKEASEEIVSTGKSILLEPNNYETHLKNLMDSLEEKEKTIANAVDKDAIASAVEKNTELTEEEASQAVDNIYDEYQKATVQVSKSMETVRQKTEEFSQEVKETSHDVLEKTDEVTDTAGKGSLYFFIGLILALIITGFAGIKGAEFLRY